MKDKKRSGMLYGVGVGPGDPELLTLKAVRVIREADFVVVPGKTKEASTAYKIAGAVLPEIDEKIVLEVDMPMTKDRMILDHSHEAAAQAIAGYLAAGQDGVFLTLGDPCIYSTFLYIQEKIKKAGFETGIISGIPSFCAACAKLGIGLAEKSEMIHIIPASYPIRDVLSLPGTRVLMKAGKKMKAVKEELLKSESDVYMVENCGMENEQIYDDANQIPPDASYYSLLIIKN